MKDIFTKFAVCICMAAVVFFVRHSAEDKHNFSLLDKSISGQAEVFWGKTLYHQYPPGALKFRLCDSPVVTQVFPLQ
jgi:hypothetical protein